MRQFEWVRVIKGFCGFIRVMYVLGAKGVCFLFWNALLVGKEVD